MRNILVTGANGFIAKNLIEFLDKDNSINVLKFRRENSLLDLYQMAAEADFICHLAGEVKPKSHKSEFEKSNFLLTKHLIDALLKSKKHISLLLASTIHSDISDNDYGRTKKKSELLVQQYSKSQQVPCYIFKIPHVFGEGCKPNHNSVITTWIYNSIHDLKIDVYNPKQKMNYVYVKDLIDDFLQCIYIQDSGSNNILRICSISHLVTLGEIRDYIVEFHENIQNTSYHCDENKFKSTLFNVYKGYYYSYFV
jgi:UDP-2-acetamido-2,6-beta-L-arabino-hexul-4-ose reductase